jgi:peptidase E
MSSDKGVIAIMGSGETTDSMVRVHRYLLEKLSRPVKAVFIDTPAGFQMNADDLYDKARDYFEKRLNHTIAQVSFKSSRNISAYEAEKAYQALRRANFIFVGPGSPTYAMKNWAGTPIPQIILERVQGGGCFVAASAAALTLGRFTLPVYEIYKVGEDLHWVEGLDLLGEFGLNLVVIPHWNNAEGGTHDTRFCYMGEPRLKHLESLLPPETPILGIDEHTACIVDFQAGQLLIRGIGGITFRHRGIEKIFKDGQALSLEEFKSLGIPYPAEKIPALAHPVTAHPSRDSFVDRVQSFQESFADHLQKHHGTGLVDVLIGLDKLIWKFSKEFEDEEAISQAREVLRGMMVQLGLHFDESPKDLPSILSPLMDILIEIRGTLRSSKQWEMADQIREKLFKAGIIVEDTPQGPRWRIKA